MKARFLIALLVPVVIVAVVSSSCSTSSSTQSPNHSSQEVATSIKTIETGTISGYVTGPAGRPASNANVMLTDPDFEEFTTKSEEDGSYTLEGVPVGNHTIIATTSGAGSAEHSVFVRANETTNKNLNF